MGEIKSTIELAMERTRHLVPTGEEQTGLTPREQRAQVLPLVRRLLRGELDSAGLVAGLAELERVHPGTAWRDAAGRQCAGALIPMENHTLLLPVLEALGFSEFRELTARVTRVVAEIETARAATVEELTGVLSSAGIGGTAVVPNPAASAPWREQRDALLAAFAADREQLLARAG